MLSKEKTTQKRAIRAEIESNGWTVTRLETTEWWENEVWSVESTWSPIGKEVFVVFESDSMYYDEKIRKAWAVRVSRERPVDRNGKPDEFQLVLNESWRKNLPKFIEHLSDLRNK